MLTDIISGLTDVITPVSYTHLLTVTVKILKTKRKKTQTRRPGYKRSPVTVCGM